MHYQPLVLIVDDDHETCRLFSRWLQRIGFATCTAHNNTEALAQALTEHPDLITTDMGRSGGSGLTFIQEVRAITALHHTPIVLISGSASEEERQQAASLGPTVIMWKPCQAPDIYASIERVFPKEQWPTNKPPTRTDAQR